MGHAERTTDLGSVLARVHASPEWRAVKRSRLSGEARLAWLDAWVSLGGQPGSVSLLASDLGADQGRHPRSGTRILEAWESAGLFEVIDSPNKRKLTKRGDRWDGLWTGYLRSPLEVMRARGVVSHDPQGELDLEADGDEVAGRQVSREEGDAGACYPGPSAELVCRGATPGSPPDAAASPGTDRNFLPLDRRRATSAADVAPHPPTPYLRTFEGLSKPYLRNFRTLDNQGSESVDQGVGGSGATSADPLSLGSTVGQVDALLAASQARYAAKKQQLRRKIADRIRCPNLQAAVAEKWAQAVAGGLIAEAELDSVLTCLDLARRSPGGLRCPPSAYFVRATQALWQRLSIRWGYTEPLDAGSRRADR